MPRVPDPLPALHTHTLHTHYTHTHTHVGLEQGVVGGGHSSRWMEVQSPGMSSAGGFSGTEAFPEDGECSASWEAGSPGLEHRPTRHLV